MTDARKRSDPATTTLPLFPLRTPLLPGVHLPLHIFEPRYRQLTTDLMSGTLPDGLFGVVAIRSWTVREVDAPGHVHTIGCAAQLREAQRLPDGRFDIITTGYRRFRLLDLDPHSAPYLLGRVHWADDELLPKTAGPAATQLGNLARTAHRRYCASAWDAESWRTPPEDVATAELAYLLASDCLLTPADRQGLLEERHPLRRLKAVCRLLTREAGILSQLHAVPSPPGEAEKVLSQADLN